VNQTVTSTTTEADSTTAEGKKTATESGAKSSKATSTSHSGSVTNTDVAAIDTTPVLAMAAGASLAQSVPGVAVSSPVASATEIKSESTSVATSLDQTVALSSSSSPLQLVPELRSVTAGGASLAAQKSGEESGSSAKQEQIPLTSNQSVASSPTLETAESTSVQEDALSPIATSTESGKLLETSAPSQNLMQQGNQAVVTIPATVGNETVDRLAVVATVTASQSGQSVEPSAAAPAVSKPGLADSGKTSTSSTLRSARGTGNSAQTTNSSIVDPSAIATEVTGSHGATSSAGELTRSSTVSTTGTDTRETFATLDAEASQGKTTWIHAGAQQAEAGFQDSSLGWVSVRADVSRGEVHAELVPSSTDAAQALGSHMAGLNAYLVEHHTPVESLSLTAPESGGTGLGSDQSASQNMQQDTGQQTGQQSAQSSDAGSQSGLSISSSALPVTTSQLTALQGQQDGSVQVGSPGGSYISVMA
jgi:hypothetical protein